MCTESIEPYKSFINLISVFYKKYDEPMYGDLCSFFERIHSNQLDNIAHRIVINKGYLPILNQAYSELEFFCGGQRVSFFMINNMIKNQYQRLKSKYIGSDLFLEIVKSIIEHVEEHDTFIYKRLQIDKNDLEKFVFCLVTDAFLRGIIFEWPKDEKQQI